MKTQINYEKEAEVYNKAVEKRGSYVSPEIQNATTLTKLISVLIGGGGFVMPERFPCCLKIDSFGSHTYI